MCNVCEKLSLLMYFLKDSPSAIKRCPVIGEFAYKNLTMDADKFGSTFGLPGERWWEYYWRTTALFYTGENMEERENEGNCQSILYNPVVWTHNAKKTPNQARAFIESGRRPRKRWMDGVHQDLEEREMTDWEERIDTGSWSTGGR
ncbi:Hypothetical protein CINCED_3A018452 [Cinara cedri]|uniref:Uncharacterized protein n=1 Tax=Cinara cedri TaxID=506608 RepID=A0A5E4N7P5_9HEMI|nr:Hypothetical protein CINCED_3A018452 [Cinara cedri]